jgi:hypothetical protein
MKLHRRTTTVAATAVLTLAISLGQARAAQDPSALMRDAAQAERAGRLADAAALYERAHKAAPSDAEAARGLCEVGLAMVGKGTLAPAAVEACHRAYLMTIGPRDGRNKVAALLTENAKPDLDRLALASLIADSVVKKAPDEPWGYLARHDLARRLERADLLAASTSALMPFAAKEPAVRVALADKVGRPPVWVWLLRLLVLMGLAATAWHALTHRSRNARRDDGSATATSTSRPATVLAVLLSLLASSPASAAPDDQAKPDVANMAQISRFKIDDAHPEEAVKTMAAATKNPLELGYLLQDLSARADRARKEGDLARAARYFHALAVAAPTPYGPRMECQALETIGDITNAIPACRELLTRKGALVSDYERFVEVVLKSPTPLHELEPKELEGVISHLEKESKNANLATVLRCKVALRFEDRAGVEKCASAMTTAPADDPTVISIKWGLAVRRNDQAAALQLVQQAEKAGVGADGLAKMRETTGAMSMKWVRKAKVVGGWAAFFIVAGIFGVKLLGASRRRAASQSSV